MDAILYGIIGVFALWEAVAHYYFRNRGAHTLSNRIAWLIAHYGWKARIPVALACAALAAHLQGAF